MDKLKVIKKLEMFSRDERYRILLLVSKTLLDIIG